MIIRQFRFMIQVKELSGSGLSQQDIAARLRLHRFVVKKATGQAMNCSMEQLEAICRKLLDTDVAIKTGKIDPPSGGCFHRRCFARIGRICEEQEPIFSVAGEDHRVACFLCQ